MSKESSRPSTNKYSLASSDEESLLEGQEHSSLLDGMFKRSSWRTQLLGRKQDKYSRFLPYFSCNLCGLVTILVASFLCTTISTYVYITHHPRSLCPSTEAYSPILRQIDLPRRPKQMDARLAPNFTDPTALIYSFPPSPEVDAAWRRISARSVISVTRDDIVGIGKDPNTAVRMNPVWGDPETYLGSVEIFHQIHCLNTLRKGLINNYDYYYGQKWGWEPPIMFELHLRHCTNMLLQTLMCHSDVEIVTNMWSEAQPWPYADFGVIKQCKDFEKLLEWTESQQIDGATNHFSDYIAPPGTRKLPEEPLLREEMGQATGIDKNGDETKMIYIKNCNA
ncbi:hypothetical protein F5Y16DRAFT_406852 [Xylariaceae sp. FL0255]|nr:hypothetical protein F5Y16DRAFT_406852 [Xylariaceae sp. FL0255]